MQLSDRYIPHRFLPDKAIDLIDEAGSARRMEIDSKPENIDSLDRKVAQLRIEQEALKKEPSDENNKRLELLETQLIKFQTQTQKLTKQWKSEMALMDRTREVQERLE